MRTSCPLFEPKSHVTTLKVGLESLDGLVCSPFSAITCLFLWHIEDSWP